MQLLKQKQSTKVGWFGYLQRCYSYGVEEFASGSCGHVIGQVTGNCPHKNQFNVMWYLVGGGCMGDTPEDGMIETMAKVAVGPLHLGRHVSGVAHGQC